MAQGDSCTCGYCPTHGGTSFHIDRVVKDEIDWDKLVEEKIIPAINKASSKGLKITI